MVYVDGFLLPLPRSREDAYRQMAEAAGRLWMEHGAVAFRECIADDVQGKDMVAFPDVIGAGAEETVVFSYIVFKSREHRDEVNAKVMADPRLKELCGSGDAPFDYKRMAYGGFRAIVDLQDSEA
jgi:uncharacterized protein YbaA (DUF1428 family)